MFLCYLEGINDCLSNVEGCNLCLYADDSNLKISGKSVAEVEYYAASGLSDLNKFFNERNLHLNTDKTNFVQFKTAQNRSKSPVNIEMDGTKIEELEKTKFLGLIVDSNLNWNDHVKSILKKISSGLYAVKRMSTLCNIDILRQIYFAHIQSHISYGICVYGATKKSNLDEILIVQKKAIRIMLRLDLQASVKEHFKELKILTVYGLYIFDTIMYVVNHEVNSKSSLIHKYKTRNKNKLITYHHRLKMFEKKTTFVGNKFFNYLPIKIKDEQHNIQKFKKVLNEFLTNLALYSIDEFKEHIL